MLYSSKELVSQVRGEKTIEFWGLYCILTEALDKGSGAVDSGLGSAAFSQVTLQVFNLLSFFTL